MRLPQPYDTYNGDDKLSFQIFSNWEFKSRPEYDFNNKVIYSSSFSNETPDSDIFGDIKGATFIKCNLDNVIIPEGNTVIDCSQKRFKVQNDLNDWEIDNNNEPVFPMVGEKIFKKLGLPLPHPSDIPSQKVVKALDLLTVSQLKKIELDKLK